MNDEINPAPELPNTPEIFTPEIPPLAKARSAPPEFKPLSYWLRKLLVCNPFYLASAALLLYGIHRVSIDPNAFATELRQLLFNSTALQVYELLLAFTAAVLATRRIYYDSSLLVALENMLCVVPFILVSQAAFIGSQTATLMCVLAVGLVIARMSWLRTRAGDIMPSPQTLLCGLPILLTNAAWPVIYRHHQETKIGVNMTSGAAYEFNEANWFWLLPTLVALLICAPRPTTDNEAKPMRRWFPLLLFSFWLVGSAVHLYSLGYVYDFKLRREQLAPALWVLAWALQLRLSHFLTLRNRISELGLICLPLIATLPATFVFESRVCFYLHALNFLGYGILALRQHNLRSALHLVLISFAALVATFPIEFAPFLARQITPMNTVGMGMLIYALIAVVFSRNPKVSIIGALAALIVGGLARQAHPDWFYWATQAGLIYFLCHSWRWEDEKHEGAGLVRMAVAGAWVAHTYYWAQHGATFTQTIAAVGLVLATWTLRGMLLRNWKPLVVPIAAGLAALSYPAGLLMQKTGAAPAGLFYVVGSFLLFGLGTLAALTKHRWHKTPHS